MKIIKPILLILLGSILALAISRCAGLCRRWERIQILESPGRHHVAALSRLYGYIDVNFRITLDGKRIYWSPDCAPNYSLPFRETLAWDTTGKILVFQLAGETVFAYNIDSGKPVDPKRFSTIQIPIVTLDDIGFEGRHLFREQAQEDIQQLPAGDRLKAPTEE